jgi:hypothetical protein
VSFHHKPLNFNSPNPFPNVTNPRTGEPFTPPQLVEICADLREALLATARNLVLSRTGAEVPDWILIGQAADSLASFCLVDALEVANSQDDTVWVIATTAQGVA